MNNKLLKKANHLLKLGQLGSAKALLRQFLIDEPENAEALYQLGSIYLLEKKYEKSCDLFNQVLLSHPHHAGALYNIGMIFFEHKNDLKSAEHYFKQVLEINANHVDSLMNLGNIYKTWQQFEIAEDFYLKALEITPHNGRLLNNLGGIFAWRDLHDEAIEYYGKALALFPNSSKIWANLLLSLNHSGKKEEALKCIEQIIKLDDPGESVFPFFYTAKMFCLWDELKVLLPDFFRMIDEGYTVSGAYQLTGLSLLASSDVTRERLFKIHQTTGKTIDALREYPAYETHEKAMRPTRRWRIGYLSPDFRNHVVDRFLRGIINAHDRDQFEIYCYSNTKQEDEVTDEYRNAANVFVKVTHLSDWQLAERIHDDGIHILIDLAGFTQDSRISVLCYRPAPVQITYLGYPYTSGLTSVDYVISDSYLDSPKNNECFTEKQLCLPESVTSFGSLSEQELRADIPWEKNQFISFGSLVNTYKLSPEVIRVWSQILHQVPDSRIILNNPNYDLETTRLNVLKVFFKHGIHKERVVFVWRRHESGSYLRHYHDIDIALDPFPLTGGMSTVDASWMGVPVIIMVGDIYPFRASYSTLSNIGIDVEDLIAFNEGEYISKAVALAAKPARISELHQAIPQSLKHSIICDPPRFTRHMEAVYKEAWTRKLGGTPISVDCEEGFEYIPVSGAVEIAVDDSPDDLNRYVLKEQGGWFDSEYAFVQDIVQPGMKVLDLSAGVGIYAIPISKKLGKEGHLRARTITSKEAWLMEKSIERNHLQNMTLIVKDEKIFKLDQAMASHSLSEIDFVRLNTTTTELKLLMSGKVFFTENSPLIMFGIRDDNNAVDTSCVPLFKSLGYESYRHIPGLDLLIPFVSDDDLDCFALNLFCCKKDQVSFLEKRGLLISKIVSVSELPGVQVKHWQNYIAPLPYASALIENWIESPSKSEEWESYCVALNLFAIAKNKECPSDKRYASLNAAYGVLSLLAEAKPTLPRLLSLCRVMLEVGKREAALNLLEQLFEIFQSSEGAHINEPFIALSDEYAAFDPEDKLAEWLFSSVLGQRERCRAFSSYFTGEESLPILEAIYETGFYTKDLVKRIKLIKQRFIKVS